ncbi:MAG: hypothetical protein ABI134_31475 [Byssovorax sp.]
MANLASDQTKSAYGFGRRQSHTVAPVKTAAVLFAFALMGLDISTGKLEPLIAGHSPNLVCVGVHNGTRMTGDGTKPAMALPGVWPMAGTGFTNADLYKPVYAVDDQTVSLSSNGGARAFVGTIELVNSATEVRVAIDPPAANLLPAAGLQVVSGQLALGVLTINSGINVTANTKVIGIVRTLVGGTFAGGGYAALSADITVGVPSVGVVKIRAYQIDGDAETACTDTLTVTLFG